MRISDKSSNIIWLADTNYRIDLANENVRRLVDADELDVLVAADQVRYGSFYPHKYWTSKLYTAQERHGFATGIRWLRRGPSDIPTDLQV